MVYERFDRTNGGRSTDKVCGDSETERIFLSTVLCVGVLRVQTVRHQHRDAEFLIRSVTAACSSFPANSGDEFPGNG